MNGRITATVAFSLIATVFTGCDNAEKQPTTKTEPAHVDRHVEEGELNRITLTEQAEQRLGIQLASVSLTEMQRRWSMWMASWLCCPPDPSPGSLL